MLKVTIVNKYKTNKPYIYAGRGSVFGNPFPMHGPSDRDRVCDLYEDYFQREIQAKGRLYEACEDLINSHEEVVLGCFCAPKRCHVETIKRYLERETLKRRRQA